MLSSTAYADRAGYKPVNMNFVEQKIEKPSSTIRASYYGVHDGSGHHTASGQPFNANGLSAAHRTLPFGTKLEVTFRGHSIIVVINDRGPASYTGRSLDLSYGAARELGIIPYGVANVNIRVIS